MHACANCKYGKKLNVHGTALDYMCSIDKDNPRRLAGTHICDIDIDGTGEQISWFDDLKEEQ